MIVSSGSSLEKATSGIGLFGAITTQYKIIQITPEEFYRAAASIVARWCNDVVSGGYASMYNVQTQLDALQNIYRKN